MHTFKNMNNRLRLSYEVKVPLSDRWPKWFPRLLDLIQVARDDWKRALVSNSWQSPITFWKGKRLINYGVLTTLLKKSIWNTIKKTNNTCHVETLVNVNHNHFFYVYSSSQNSDILEISVCIIVFLYSRCVLSNLDYHNDFGNVALSFFESYFECWRRTEYKLYSLNKISKCNNEATISVTTLILVTRLVPTPLLDDY